MGSFIPLYPGSWAGFRASTLLYRTKVALDATLPPPLYSPLIGLVKQQIDGLTSSIIQLHVKISVSSDKGEE